METKVCSKCKIEKEVCEFRKNKDKFTYHCKLCLKEFREQNRDYFIKRSKDWYNKNSENFNKKRWIETKNNPEKLEKVKNAAKNWEKNNRKKRNEYAVNKRKNDSLTKLSENIRTRIRLFLKKEKLIKKSKTQDIVGCDINFLKEYIERQFKDGMTWENQGKNGWHIDHIIPLSHAKTEEEIYKLCHYTNLQPLWAFENLSKNNRYVG